MEEIACVFVNGVTAFFREANLTFGTFFPNFTI